MPSLKMGKAKNAKPDKPTLSKMADMGFIVIFSVC